MLILLHTLRTHHGAQLSVIQTYPQLIGYDTAVYEYFRQQYVIMCASLSLSSILTTFRTTWHIEHTFADTI